MAEEEGFKLKQFAEEHGIELRAQKDILKEATNSIAKKYNYNKEEIKEHFDSLIFETEKEAYRIYLEAEQEYGGKVFDALVEHLIATKQLEELSDVGSILSEYFHPLDRFFLSLKQSRTTRAGKTFEGITKNLFKVLEYPHEDQVKLAGGSIPDFLMPSAGHYNNNAPDCIIFTSKRTLRERWRQVVTEGTRGLGFYLATLDEQIPRTQLSQMLEHRIYVVVPEQIRKEKYEGIVNVISFKKFFNDYLDPAVTRWKNNGII